jgi:hypothetical protein
VLLVFVGLLLVAIVLSLVHVFMLCSVAQLRPALMPCIGLYLLLLLNARAGHLPFSVKKIKRKQKKKRSGPHKVVEFAELIKIVRTVRSSCMKLCKLTVEKMNFLTD